MTNSHSYIEKLSELTSSGISFVAVTLVDAIGSTPQDTGSKMLVTASGIEFGTVGGGRVERMAIEHAREMLTSDCKKTSFVEWNLQRDVGMTCGGTVKLFFETVNHRPWHIVVFGAGHVARALTNILITLDCHITCYDPREPWVAALPNAPKLTKIIEPNLPTRIAELNRGAYILCMTMGHRTDRPILEEIFRQGIKFPYLGVIGSLAKRKVLIRELIESGIDENIANDFHCPIGLDIGTNQPSEIAISVTAQLIAQRDKKTQEK